VHFLIICLERKLYSNNHVLQSKQRNAAEALGRGNRRIVSLPAAFGNQAIRKQVWGYKHGFHFKQAPVSQEKRTRQWK